MIRRRIRDPAFYRLFRLRGIALICFACSRRARSGGAAGARHGRFPAVNPNKPAGLPIMIEDKDITNKNNGSNNKYNDSNDKSSCNNDTNFEYLHQYHG